MSGQPGQRRPGPLAQTFVACLRHFLSPALLKQVYPLCPQRRGRRWALQPLLVVLLAMTWCAGDSQAERFEVARGFYVALAAKRKRPGKTVQGFQKALTALPAAVLRAVADLFRRHLLARFGPHLEIEGWKVFGVDGTRLRCPRSAELERRLGNPGGDQKDDPVPQVWLTALVHLGSGLLWSWQVGKGDASERHHLTRLLPTLPAAALLVADAGYQGYELARALLQNGAHFLIRVSSQTTFYEPDTLSAADLRAWTDGEVYYWPNEAQKAKALPLKVRLLRIRSKRCKHDVWLVSSVLDQRQLSRSTAGRFYRLRWENEGFFRTYKRTLGKVKLQGRTVATVHREVLGSLLAVQVLLAQGAQGLLLLGQKQAVSSARQLLLGVRREIAALVRGQSRGGYLKRAAACQRERQPRASVKQKREWPGRQKHKPPKPPRIRQLTEKQKALFERCLQTASRG